MKKILTILLLLLSVFSFAQGPVIEGTYLPVKGTSVKQVWDTTSGSFTVPAGGPNQIWDYSNQFTHVVDTFQIKTFDPSASPYGHYFPSATHATYLRTPFDNQSDSLYTYLVIDAAGVHSVGGFNIKAAYDTSLIMNPGELLLPAICTYGMQMFDTSRSIAYSKIGSWPVKIIETKHKIMNGYGYGTLKMPNGNFNNVLLAKEDIEIKDSIFVDFANTGNYIYYTTQFNNYIAYAFIRNNTFGSSYLMHLSANVTNTVVNFGWYAVPVDFGSISGTVYDSIGGSIVTNGEAYLYRENSNFAKNDILDISPLDVNGNYQFDSIPYGEYRIAIRPDPLLYPNALTTYYGDSTNWISAPSIITSTNSIVNDIHLQYYPPVPGSGIINGNLGLDFTVRAATPIPGIDVVVRKKPSGKAMQEAKTDASGNFSLSTLSDGLYDLFVDIPGLHMTGTYEFTISGGTLVSGMDFTVGTDSIHPVSESVTVGINENKNADNLMTAYPNPYAFNTSIKINVTEKSDILLEVYNVLGEKIQTLDKGQKQTGSYTYSFNAKSLNYSSGIYIVKLTVGNKTNVLKIIEQ
jgi:hypothetical protein